MTESVVGKVTKNYIPKGFEGEILNFWQGANIYRKVKIRSERKEKFYFLDGPPYVTNPPHVGTAWNKILKDVIIRYKRMKGYNVRDQPGYDCHGLPIEVKVEEDLHIKSKKEIETEVTVEKFIDRCRTYALENANKQTAIFRDLGVWMDWDNPYMTLEKEYMESVWWTIKKAAEKGLLEKGLKVVHWCPRCETALAGYEVTDEYRNVKDHSIYVKFPVEKNTSILIWTTTPWTLPANVAVMVHPDEKYVQVESMGEHYILAEKRCDAVFKTKGADYKIVKKFSGKELEGIKYHSPLHQEVMIQRIPENPHIVVLSREYVSMSEGTGCVHTAPGHGEEDFEVGREKSLPTFSPVDGSGRFTKEAGKYHGAHVRDMNLEIIRDLQQNEALFMEALIEHSYPHCWRCKTPLLMRTTEQWFIKISSFKESMIKENSKVYWAPEWAGSKRFADWLKGARDWVISRQRFWGVPLPIWVCAQCGRNQVVGSSSELELKAGIQKPIPDLHRHVIDKIQLKCGCGGTLNRVPDIIDVWLDSGVASWASLGYPKKLEGFKVWWPADAITEAHDQTRGWFYTQLGASVLCFEKAPYKAVLMHGHTLDPVGQKMSKSMGNFIAPEEVVEKFGRDTLRLSFLQMTTWEDSRFSWEKIEETFRSLKIVWNILSFASLYMNLDKFHPSNLLIAKKDSMRTEDRWLLSRTENLKTDITRALDCFEIHVAARRLIEFAIEDLSHWYVRAVRRRFWQEKESPDKIAAYTVLYYALQTWILVAAPFIPFFTEKAYREFILPTGTENLESLHMNNWPPILQRWVDEELETMMKDVREVTEAVVSARQALKIKLRQPVGKLLVFTEEEVKRSLQGLEDLLLFISNAKKIEYLNVETAAEIEKLSLSPKYEVIGPIYKADASRIGEELRRLDGQKVLDVIDAQGFYTLKIDSTTYKITPSMIICKEEMPTGYSKGSFSKGRVYIEAKLSDDLIAEGFVRDIIRRIQEMRRLMDLPVDAYISVVIKCPKPRFKNWLIQNEAFLKEETRAIQLTVLKLGEKIPNRDLFKKSWQIEGSNFDIGIRWIKEKD